MLLLGFFIASVGTKYKIWNFFWFDFCLSQFEEKRGYFLFFFKLKQQQKLKQRNFIFCFLLTADATKDTFEKNSQKFQMGESLITYKVKMVVNIALLLTVDFCYKKHQ